MPHYFFDVYNDDRTMDDEGVDLVDAHAARAHAVKEARALASDTVLHGHLNRSDRIEIRDANHEVVGSVSFEDAVDIRS